MIGKAVIDFLAGLASWVVGMLPSGSAPGWLGSYATHIGPVWSAASGLGAWLPWSLIGTVVSWVLSCLAAGFVIKVVRIIASFFTAGGGSAA